MQAVHNAPNEMRRHLDSGGNRANAVSQDSKMQSQPLPPGTSKGYYFNVSTSVLLKGRTVCQWRDNSIGFVHAARAACTACTRLKDVHMHPHAI
jgi:hypothetical protein